MKLRTQEEETLAALKEWQETGQMPSADVLSKMVAAKNEVNINELRLNRILEPNLLFIFCCFCWENRITFFCRDRQ